MLIIGGVGPSLQDIFFFKLQLSTINLYQVYNLLQLELGFCGKRNCFWV